MSVEPAALAAVVAHVDRTSADVAAAALESYGISATVVTDTAAGNAKAPVSPAAPVHGVLVHRHELALALDILRRIADGLPAEFRDDEVERWSEELDGRRGRETARMLLIGAVCIAFFAIVVVLAVGAISALTH